MSVLGRRNSKENASYYRFVSRNEARSLFGLIGLPRLIVAFFTAHAVDVLLLSDPPFWFNPLLDLLARSPFADVSLVALVSLLISLVSLIVLVMRLYDVFAKREKLLRSLRRATVYASETATAVQAVAGAGRSGTLALEEVCHQGADYCYRLISEQMPRSGIGCAIRLAEESGYVTIARAGRLSPDRELKSEPVQMDGPIVGILTSEMAAQSELIICPDVKRAHDDGKLDRDGNSDDEELAAEIKSMVVSPIVIGIEGRLELAGILYITSDRIDAFDEGRVDLLVSMSKIIGSMVSVRLDLSSDYNGQGIELGRRTIPDRRKRRGRR